MPYRALEIARYIINKCTEEQHPISNLQLQKILYYIQRTYLLHEAVAFSDEIEAWQFGPVVPDVYYHFCGFGSLPIRMKYETSLEPKDCIIIDPWDMVDDTHMKGKAWDTVYRNGAGNRLEIPRELIREKG